MMDDELHALAAAYAIDALDELERHRFEVHLRTCAQCRAEVDDFLEVAADLPARDVDPPARLRAATLDLVARTPQELPGGDRGDRGDGAGGGDGATVDPAPRGASVGPGDGPSSAWGSTQWILGAAAVLLALVALAVVALVATRTSGDGSGDEVAEVLTAPDAVHTPMHGDDRATESSELEVVHSASHGAAVVVGDDVPRPEPGRTYQLWGITPQGPVSAGVFEPGGDGTVEVSVGAPEGTSAWAVTVEPAGGSAVATTDPVFTSDDI